LSFLRCERHPFDTLEIVSANGRTYRLWTGEGGVTAVFGAETEEVLWQMFCGMGNDGGNTNE